MSVGSAALVRQVGIDVAAVGEGMRIEVGRAAAQMRDLKSRITVTADFDCEDEEARRVEREDRAGGAWAPAFRFDVAEGAVDVDVCVGAACDSAKVFWGAVPRSLRPRLMDLHARASRRLGFNNEERGAFRTQVSTFGAPRTHETVVRCFMVGGVIRPNRPFPRSDTVSGP